MYIVAALIAALGFALETTIITKLYRTMRPEVISSLRGLSFSVSMLPLLLWGYEGLFLITGTIALILLFGSCVTFLGNTYYARAVSLLPVGIAQSSGASAMTLTAVAIGIIVFNEELTTSHLIALPLLIIANWLLSGAIDQTAALNNSKRGFFFALAYGVLGAIGNICMSFGARTTHPFVAGYLWDVGSGVMGFLMNLARGKNILAGVTTAQFFRVVFYCSPSAVGVGAFAYASAIGPIGMVNAIVITGVLVGSTVLAQIFYDEALTRNQWLGIGLVCLALGVARL